MNWNLILFIGNEIVWFIVVICINNHWKREYRKLLDYRRCFDEIFLDDGK